MTKIERGSTSSWYIKAMFESCCWKSLDSVRINVEVEPGRVLKIHRLRIKEKRHAIARMLQHARKDMCRSNNPKGMPWRAARMWADGTTMDEQAAEYVIALGVAAGFVTIVPHKVESLDNWIQHFAVIEDVRIANWLAEEKRDKRQEKTPSENSQARLLGADKPAVVATDAPIASAPSMGRTSDIAGK